MRNLPSHVLLISEDFTSELTAERVAAHIARGLQAGGQPEPDLCPFTPLRSGESDLRSVLDTLGFDQRMRAARAVLIATPRLCESTLDASLTFEVATRARQAGVPSYAITAENKLNSFDARILDLQVILQADSARTLSAAGKRLATI